MPYLKTRDNAQLFYKDWGSGKPVVLIHGWPLSADTWDEVATEIALKGMRAIIYDRRGFGRSEQTWNGYDYDSLTEDLADVINALQLRDVSLVGFSMGGGEVARYMSMYKGQGVKRIAFIASVVPYMLNSKDNPHGVDQSVFDGMLEGMQTDRASFFGQFFKDFYGDGTIMRSVSNEVLEWSLRQAMQASYRATVECAKSFASTDFRPDLRACIVPALVVHGSADKTVPIDATGRVLADQLAEVQFCEYSDAPHGLFATHRQRLIDDLLTFLSGKPIQQVS